MSELTFRDKLRSLQFPRVRNVTVKDRETGLTLGIQHHHVNGSMGATVLPQTGEAHVAPQTPGT